MVKRYAELYADTRRAILNSEDAPNAGVYARMLICQASGKSQAEYLAEKEHYAPEKVVAQVERNLKRLLSGEPMAYILGQWEFYGLGLHVSNAVLIPRDDTVAVTELAIRYALFLEKDPRILDLCCGSGCIGLAVASHVKDARVTLADLSQEALSVAKENVTLHKLGGRVRCVRANALESASDFLGKFDLIVSNPPYVTAAEMEQLPGSVKDFEPTMALFGGEDGLDFYRSIAANYAKALRPGGYLCLEFGMGQGPEVSRILEEQGYTVLERTRDYNDRERAVVAQLRQEG